jgi:hypothetical protein
VIILQVSYCIPVSEPAKFIGLFAEDSFRKIKMLSCVVVVVVIPSDSIIHRWNRHFSNVNLLHGLQSLS